MKFSSGRVGQLGRKVRILITNVRKNVKTMRSQKNIVLKIHRFDIDQENITLPIFTITKTIFNDAADALDRRGSKIRP